jgi:hypothetical protein
MKRFSSRYQVQFKSSLIMLNWMSSDRLLQTCPRREEKVRQIWLLIDVPRYYCRCAVVVAIVWEVYFDLHLPVESLPINTSSLNSISVHGVIYSIQQCIRNYVRVCSFSIPFYSEQCTRGTYNGKFWFAMRSESIWTWFCYYRNCLLR